MIEHFGTTGRAAPEPHPELHRLTEREREIVAWVATGRSNTEIAEELVVARHGPYARLARDGEAACP